MENVTSVALEFYKIPTVDIVITILGSVCSIFGAFVIFLVHYFMHRDGQRIGESRRLLIYLTVADLVLSIGYLSGIPHIIQSRDYIDLSVCGNLKEKQCVAQSFITTFSSLSTFFWTTCIAFDLFWSYGDSERQHETECCNRYYLYPLLSLGIPFVITILAYVMDTLGSDLSVGSGARCWTSSCLTQNEKTLWTIFTGKGWEIMMYFTSFSFYLLLKWRKIKRRKNIKQQGSSSVKYPYIQTELHNLTKEDIRFSLLWLIELGLRIFGTIRYLAVMARRHTGKDLSNPDSFDLILLHFQSFGDTAQAFFSFLIFCVFDKEARSLLKQKLFSSRTDIIKNVRSPLLQKSTAL